MAEHVPHRLQVAAGAQHEGGERPPDDVELVPRALGLDLRRREQLRDPPREQAPVPPLSGSQVERRNGVARPRAPEPLALAIEPRREVLANRNGALGV